ncbi:transcriptional regulator LuxT [Vibrio astriarenae]|nr:transcriptional regulator LuxT [Vibrio sp. C7]
MARITKAKWEENFANYNAIILRIFLNEGWDHVTYDRLSKETGLRKSTLQGYYPSNTDFEVALKGKVFPIIAQHLDFESKEALIASWQSAMTDTQFRMVMRMFVMHAYKKGADGSGRQGVLGLGKLIADKLPKDDALETIRLLFGLTVTELMGIDETSF